MKQLIRFQKVIVKVNMLFKIWCRDDELYILDKLLHLEKLGYTFYFLVIFCRQNYSVYI